jgi:hypothetical protein
VADYIFTMIRASKFYGANRKVLEDITLCGISSRRGTLKSRGTNSATRPIVVARLGP